MTSHQSQAPAKPAPFTAELGATVTARDLDGTEAAGVVTAINGRTVAVEFPGYVTRKFYRASRRQTSPRFSNGSRRSGRGQNWRLLDC